jgi:hypothetical protein
LFLLSTETFQAIYQSYASCAVVKSEVEANVNTLVIQGFTVTAPVCPLTDVTAQLSASHQYQSAVFFNTYPVVAVPHGLNSDTVTAPVLPFTELTGKLIEVSVIAVTCHSVLVVIVGTFVEVHLEV